MRQCLAAINPKTTKPRVRSKHGLANGHRTFEWRGFKSF